MVKIDVGNHRSLLELLYAWTASYKCTCNCHISFIE